MSITVLNEKAIAVNVPELSHEHHTYNKGTGLCYWDNDACSYEYIDLPPGKWSLLGMFDKLTEDEWKGVVQKDEDGYWINYNWKSWHSDSTSDTATESGKSLLKQKGITTPHLILVKNGKPKQ